MLTVHEHYVYSVVCCPRRAFVGPVLRAWTGGNDTIYIYPGTTQAHRGRPTPRLPTCLSAFVRLLKEAAAEAQGEPE